MGNSIEPWRTFEKGGSWTENYKQKLFDDIRNATHKNINILLLGQVASGKSSYMNSVASIIEGRMSEVSQTGSDARSVTKRLKVFAHEKLGHIRLFDTMGIGDENCSGLNIKDVISVVNGNVSPNYRFNPAGPIGKEDAKFKTHPSIDDKMHCVVFVMDANIVDRSVISRHSIMKVRELEDALAEKDIPRIILLTKTDVLCEAVKRDITKTYESPILKEAMNQVQRICSSPERNIFPVQNYTKELTFDYQKDVLLLLALRQMVYFAKDCLEHGSLDSDDEDD